jgi:hypothetical protein
MLDGNEVIAKKDLDGMRIIECGPGSNDKRASCARNAASY